jgi:hypothetical protein
MFITELLVWHFLKERPCILLFSSTLCCFVFYLQRVNLKLKQIDRHGLWSLQAIAPSNCKFN